MTHDPNTPATTTDDVHASESDAGPAVLDEDWRFSSSTQMHEALRRLFLAGRSTRPYGSANTGPTLSDPSASEPRTRQFAPIRHLPSDLGSPGGNT